jgi:acyl-CoA thioester hydrolase
MFVKNYAVRVRYAETDQMGVVYYGNYPQYFEVGRVEALRTLGMSYKQMEEDGIMLPVLKLEIKYIRPATYDDLITITTKITELPSSRITFEHEIRNEGGELLTVGMVQLVFVTKANKKPCRAPQGFIDTLMPYFD